MNNVFGRTCADFQALEHECASSSCPTRSELTFDARAKTKLANITSHRAGHTGHTDHANGDDEIYSPKTEFQVRDIL